MTWLLGRKCYKARVVPIRAAEEDAPGNAGVLQMGQIEVLPSMLFDLQRTAGGDDQE
jgi:hypothetical protein